MRVVFPLPRKPVIIVTGVGVMLADGLGNCLKSGPTLCWKIRQLGWPYGGGGTGRDSNDGFLASLLDQVQALANLPGKLKPNVTALEG
jgi:hypothetical protein